MKRPIAVAVAVCTSTVLLAACGEPSGRDAADDGASAGYGTREVTDCSGTTSTFTAPPERVATVTTSVLEFLLAMGLEDRVAGVQAVGPGAFPADLQETADGFPKLGGEYVPGNFVPVQREQLLTAEPDFVIGGWPSNFDSSAGALSQQELTERGIPSYYAFAAACDRTEPVTDLSVVYRDVENYGAIFAEEDAATAVVDGMKETVAAVREAVGDAEPPAVFSYSWEDGRGDAYAVGNQNLSNAVITLAGGENIFGDVDAVYQSVGWEDVVDRDPDLIVLEVFGKATEEEFDAVVAEVEEFFLDHPALQNVTAVRNRAFLPVIAESYYIGGVRNAEAVEKLAGVLHPDAFGD
ncbi:ABC transporter substrate-binding protein [Streptomyces bohaiensis]|uniref:ABC transporter substrate-binding protein n=1 Tax=Streptomyces bohaiensis TaxID=1431344 RepID=UPI003B763B09